jgi:hypothetical protein
MKENKGCVTALYNNKYSNSASLSFPGSYPRVWEKKDKKIIWVIWYYDYQSIMVFSINFGLGLTSNKTWGCYKYKPFDLWTAQLFSFLSEILSMEWRPKREKRNVTLLWAVFSAPTSLSKINFSDKPYFHKLPICSKYLCCCFFYSYSLHFY